MKTHRGNMLRTEASASSAICIQGRSVLHRSNAYWHFAQGHLLETFVLLQEGALYHPGLQMSFGDPQFFASWRKYLAFYLTIFDSLPVLDRDCKRAKREGARILRFPEFGMGPSRNGPHKAFLLAENTSLVRACRWLPRLHALVAERRGTQRLGARPPHMVLLQRPNGSAAGGPGRRILNADIVGQLLTAVAREHGAHLTQGNIDGMAPLEQVDLLLRTDVLLSYHGSGVGSGHFWMAPGTVVVEFQPPGVPYCIFATCGAASGKAWVESSDTGTPQMEIWKPGGWNSKWYICNPSNPMQQCHRVVDARPALRIISHALASLPFGRHPLGRNTTVDRSPGHHARRVKLTSSAQLAGRALRASPPLAREPVDYALRMKRAVDRFVRGRCGGARDHGCARACGKRVLQVWEGNRSCAVASQSKRACSIAL